MLNHFFKKLKVKILIKLINTQAYRWFTLNIIARIRFSMYYTNMKGAVYHEGYKLLKPGDIILTKDKKKLNTHIIGGEWAHTGLCISKNRKFECVEMTSKHYTKSTFADMCFEADRVAIIRCTDFDQEYIRQVIAKALSFEGARYDTVFTLKNEFLYCSELIYESDFERRLEVSLEDLAFIGNPYISPTGIANAGNIKVIWDSKYSHAYQDVLDFDAKDLKKG